MCDSEAETASIVASVPLPSWLARLNRAATNKVLGPVTRRVPPGAVVIHRGRRSGREYRTPVLAFHRGEEFVVALTYGRTVDWVANVLVAGGCDLERAGTRVSLVDPVLVSGDDAEALLPGWVRPVLRVMGVGDAIRMRSAAIGR